EPPTYGGAFKTWEALNTTCLETFRRRGVGVDRQPTRCGHVRRVVEDVGGAAGGGAGERGAPDRPVGEEVGPVDSPGGRVDRHPDRCDYSLHRAAVEGAGGAAAGDAGERGAKDRCGGSVAPVDPSCGWVDRQPARPAHSLRRGVE